MPFKVYSRTYQAWQNMKARCKHTHRPHYKYWVGVSVCPEWLNSYKTFLQDMGEAPPGLTLDRLNGAKVYSKETCAWTDRKAQTNNRTLTKLPKSGHRYITKDKTRANSYCIQIKTSLGKVSTRANSLEKAIVVRDEILHRRQCVNPA